MNTQFHRVRRDFDVAWLSSDHRAFITYSEPVAGIRAGYFQAFRAESPSDQTWNSHAKRVGSADGFDSFEAAAAAITEQLRHDIERCTGKALPQEAVTAYQHAFRVEAFDREGVCVFAADGCDELYRLGVDMRGVFINVAAAAAI